MMTRYRTSLTILLLLTLALSLMPVAGQTNEPYWPTDGWRTSTPEEQGMDSAVLVELINELESGVSVSAHSVLVIRHGYVVLDASSAPYRSDRQHSQFSVTKSVISMLVGSAIQQGLIKSADQSIWDFFPTDGVLYMDDARKQAIQIRHLLTMSSGLAYDRAGVSWYEDPMFTLPANGPAWVDWMLNQPMTDEPGKTFFYMAGQPQLLSAIIQRTSSQAALEFAQKSLFAPLGITDVTWAADPQGVTLGATGLFLTPQDMAKLGYLYLRQGEWDGQQIVSPAWVQESVTDFYELPPDYGYFWWVNASEPIGYFAEGYGGQEIFVLPEQDMIVVMTGEFRGMGRTVRDLAVSAVTSDQPLPPNPAAQQQIQALVEAWQNPAPVEVISNPELETRISGQMYTLRSNSEKWTAVGLTFAGDQAVLTLEIDGSHLELPVGLDGTYRISEHGLPVISAGERLLADVPLAAQGRWGRGEIFIVHLRDLLGMQELELLLNFKDGLVLSLSENYTMAALGRYGFAVRGSPQ